MANQEVKVFFKVDGLDGYINDLGDLQKALGQADDATKGLNNTTDNLKKSSKSAKLFGKALEGAGKLGKKGFQLIGAGIKATGLGVFLNLGSKLVDWFNETDTGAKLIQGSLAVVGTVFSKISDLVAPLGDKISALFSDPKQALIDFGTAIKDSIISRFEGILNFIPSMASAIENLFKGNFKEAGKIAFDAVAQVTTGVEGASDKIADFAEDAVEAFNDVVEATVNAVKASNTLINAQNNLRKTQQDLTVENARLNQELETQQKIADDTTRSYDERKAALDRVNAANEQLADNAVRLAEEEKSVLEQQLALATTEEQRREIKDQLADAEATLIDAETQAQIVRLESAQLNRELDQEEADRLQELKDNKAEADAEEAERKKKIREDELKAIEEQNKAVIAAEESLQDAKFNATQQGISALKTLAGENEKLQNALFLVDKAVAIGKLIVDSVKAKAANLAYAAGLGPAGPAYLAAANQAVNINTAAGIATIAATTIAKFKNGGSGGVNTPDQSFNPGSSINYSFGQQAGGTIQPGQLSTGQQTPPPTQTYVLASDVTSAQEAQAQIENLSRL